MSTKRVDQLAPWLVPYARAMVEYYRECTVTSVYRSYSEQLELWRNRERSPYPVAPPGRSYHQLRRAWDMTGPPEVLAEAGRIWRSWGGTWSSSDPIHFQA